ncbi:MAG: potassium-transporting ATPase subunit KdpC [Hyphomicrobium sp.]
MLAQLRPALAVLGFFTFLTGFVYPLALTGMAQLLMPTAAKGSLIVQNGKVVGSELIGQGFTQERYFHGRPSAAGKEGYEASASSGSNLGATSKALIDRVAADVAKLREAETGLVPGDAVTASASGLDPHISPAFAEVQIARVARARGTDPKQVSEIVERLTEHPFMGFLGQARISVLKLNLALDAELGSVTR